MINEDSLNIEHSFSPNLNPGDVALVIPVEGPPMIYHNIASLAETGRLQSGSNAAGILMTLALVDVISHDEQAFAAAMRRVAMKLEGNQLRLV